MTKVSILVHLGNKVGTSIRFAPDSPIPYHLTLEQAPALAFSIFLLKANEFPDPRNTQPPRI